MNREFGIAGIDGAKRRTDLELVFGNRRAIVVEVKKGSADIIDVRQLQDQLQHSKDSIITYFLRHPLPTKSMVVDFMYSPGKRSALD